MNMSTLIKTEHDNWKKRMIVETCGTYVLMNMGMGFVVIAGGSILKENSRRLPHSGLWESWISRRTIPSFPISAS